MMKALSEFQNKSIAPESLDPAAFFKLASGLYLITSKDDHKDNGMICNSVLQVTNTPNRLAVCVNQNNYSCELIRRSGLLNVNCLSVDAPFRLFQIFGFQSGRTADKFAGLAPLRTDNGLAVLPEFVNALFSLQVEQQIDLGTHCLFIGAVTEARVLSDRPTVTYDYYQTHIKPKPQPAVSKQWRCKICGHIYQGDVLPDDYICPICGHPKDDFELVN